MAQLALHASANHFDMEQILSESQQRWLRTPEICEILRNYKRFSISPEPPHLPPSGSLFLYDRKVLRYFRKDGHSWRKKKDGKTIKEAHEKLKAGSVDVLHCYYAHGEDNRNFQRRSYWMLEEEFSHIVLVHYWEVKGVRTNVKHIKEAEEAVASDLEIEQNVCDYEVENSMKISSQQFCCRMLSQNSDSRSLHSAHESDYEDSESGYSQDIMSNVPSLDIDKDRSSLEHQKELDLWGWKHALEGHDARILSAAVKPSVANRDSDSVDNIDHSKDLFCVSYAPEKLKVSMEDCDSYSGLACEQKDTTDGKLHESHGTDHMRIDGHTVRAMDYGLQMQLADGSCKGDEQIIKSGSNMPIDNILSLSSAAVNLDRPFEERTLKKNDSFSQWMSKELGDVESVTLSSSGAYWDNVDIGSDCPSISPQSELDPYTIGPSLSQHQLFRIIDFSPNWAYAGCRTKVLIAGEFLITRENVSDCQWSCMFGEVEVPAEVINDGVLRCYTPLHDVARIPFYITCSNRLACSEIREFEYRHRSINDLDGIPSRHECEALRVRFAKLLSRGSGCYLNTLPSCGDNLHLCSEITSLLKGDNEDWNQILTTTSGNEHYTAEVNMRLAEKLLKEKLCEWIINKIVEGGKDLRIFDENGQGVLHLAAALGYDWAISPTVIAGVNINFRDLHGWTALHWAAFYGRERMVVYLISLGASAGALTDPIPTYPMGRPAADLASENGHKGIAGYLAESALSAHLECLTFKDGNGLCNTHVLTDSEPIGTPISDGDSVEGISLKDSLTALCNATQAAARIHQVYRMLSFQRKQITDLGDGISGKLEIDADRAVTLITMKTHKQSHRDEPVHAAAVRIQNKFRSWKSRRQFLSLRHQVVKIQAHFRGHQVRKNYRKFVWSVGIVEKVILRWRRKRNGLRGFKPESLAVEPLSEGTSQKKDDYDFLKKGRKQAEERTQKALSRVKSMVRHPEARDQYHRLLSTVSEIREMKNECRGTIAGASEATSMDDDLIDVDVVLNDGSISAE